MTLNTRRARPGDMDAVLALYRELRPHDPPLPEATAAHLWETVHDGPGSFIFVCEDENSIGATCMLALVDHLASGGRPIGLVEHVITAAPSRRKGMAQACLRLALSDAWQRGCCKVLLLSGAQRTEAHRLYARVGFDGDVERGFVIKRPHI